MRVAPIFKLFALLDILIFSAGVRPRNSTFEWYLNAFKHFVFRGLNYKGNPFFQVFQIKIFEHGWLVDEEVVALMAMSVFSSDLLQHIKDSWEADPHLQQLIDRLKHQGGLEGKFKFVDGLLHGKGKLMVGCSPNLQKKLISLFHDSPMGEHSRVHAILEGASLSCPRIYMLLRSLSSKQARECGYSWPSATSSNS